MRNENACLLIASKTRILSDVYADAGKHYCFMGA